jgi:protein-S-isoprenylcysteine O-methyltransferase Ste14
MDNGRERKRIIALILGGIVTVAVLPILLALLALCIDRWLNLPIVLQYPLNLVISIPILIVGFFWGIWANINLFSKGQGGPIPTKATETIFLVNSGPYKYCRNPMIFGYVLIFVGLGLLLNSWSLMVLMSSIVFGLLIVYVKFKEERDLEKRFGESYKNYKKNTSLLIPWIPKKGN